MDPQKLNFLIGNLSPAPLAPRKVARPTPNKREGLYKKSNVGKTKDKTRLRTMTSRNEKKNQMGMMRRGIEMDQLSDEEKLEEKPPKVKGSDRMKRLEEFRKQKEVQKIKDAQNKKPPFRVGAYHGFGNVGAMGKLPWNNKKSMKKNEVFVFKGNKTTTRSAHNSKASSVQVPKKTSTVPKPILKSKENVEENDQEMKSLNSTFDKDDEEKIDDKTTKENLNSTFEKKIDNEEKMKTPKNETKIAKTSGKKSATKKKTDDEESEENDQVPDTLTFMTPKRTVRTPILKKSPGEEAFVQLTPKLNALLERGTDSDKRRKREGKTPGKTPAEILDIGDVGLMPEKIPEVLSEAKDVNYFKKILEETDKKLTEKCQIWENKMEQVPKSQKDYEDICSNIRSTIGKANLLMNKKGRFEQFRGLIYNCEFNLGEQKTTAMDLQGFWEMIYFQVEDVEQKFVDLTALEERNWQNEKPQQQQKIVKKVIKNKTAFKPKAKASSNLRQMLAEKRKAMLQQAKDDMPAIVVTEEKSSDEKAAQKSPEEKVTFDAGFFKVTSPISKSPRSEKRKSDATALRRSVLSKRVSISGNPSTPLAIMKATQNVRRSMSNSRENSPVVKILDYDLEETKENQPDNNFLKPNESPMTSFLGPSRKSLAVPKSDLMSFDSPSTPKGTPRRSTRLSSAQKINYKETELFKKSLVAATAELNLFSPNTPRKRSPRSRSPSPAL